MVMKNCKQGGHLISITGASWRCVPSPAKSRHKTSAFLSAAVQEMHVPEHSRSRLPLTALPQTRVTHKLSLPWLGSLLKGS